LQQSFDDLERPFNWHAAFVTAFSIKVYFAFNSKDTWNFFSSTIKAGKYGRSSTAMDVCMNSRYGL
jgi:hypothetical protein